MVRPSHKAGALSARDPDARWTKRSGGGHFGYKMHISVDQGSCLVHRAAMAAANVNDTVEADHLVMGDEGAVYADMASSNHDRRARLKARGIKDRIMPLPHKTQPQLPPWKQRRNALISQTRRQVEKIFGTLKRRYGYRQVRYLGLMRNDNHLQLLCVALNMRRTVVLAP